MATPVDFIGSNLILHPPKGDEETVSTMRAFTNGRAVVSCWELTAEELEKVVRTGKVFVSIHSGGTIFPMFVGDDRSVRDVVSSCGHTIPQQE